MHCLRYVSDACSSVIPYGATSIHLADASLHSFYSVGLHERPLDLAVVVYLVGLVLMKLVVMF